MGPGKVFALARAMAGQSGVSSTSTPTSTVLTSQLTWVAGLAAGAEVLGPSDQALDVRPGASQQLNLMDSNGTARLFVTTGGRVGVTAGTAASPGVQFDGDTDLGFFRLAADQYAITCGGLTRKVFGGSITLTDNVATTICTIALASGARVGGTIHYSIDVTDNTDHQVRTGSVDFAAVDKATTLTSQITENDTQAVAVSAGTLTDAWSISDGTNAISIQVTADSSLTPTSMVIRFELSLFGSAATVTVP